MNSERSIAYRKQAAALLEALFENAITPRAALNSWPMEGNQDPSVRCAYTVLWYFEADRDERHQQEQFYADLQVRLLMDIATCLKKGDALAPKLLAEYQAQLAPTEYHPKSTLYMGLVRWSLAAWQAAKQSVMPLFNRK